jgi:hypothetical protein
VTHFVVHDAPVWRDRSDTILSARIPDPADSRVWYEQLWAARIDESHYEICCIPFATYEFALGDVVAVGVGAAAAGEPQYLVEGLQRRSGRAVLRAWLAESERGTWDALQELLRSLGLMFEFRKPALVAIDVPDEHAAASVEDELRRQQATGLLNYERGSQGYQPQGVT